MSEKERLPFARSFRELLVYGKSRQVARELFELSQRFPAEERFSLTDQVRRSSRSVGAQIAEAWAKREYERHFCSKLTDADAEQQETQHWIEIAAECGYVSQATSQNLLQACVEIGRMLQSMKERAHSFCPNGLSSRVKEEEAEQDFVAEAFSDY
jgi:four helix bundle protein